MKNEGLGVGRPFPLPALQPALKRQPRICLFSRQEFQRWRYRTLIDSGDSAVVGMIDLAMRQRPHEKTRRLGRF